MRDQLIIAVAWLILAGFFMYLNIRTGSKTAKFLSWWGMALSICISVGLVVVTSLEILRG